MTANLEKLFQLEGGAKKRGSKGSKKGSKGSKKGSKKASKKASSIFSVFIFCGYSPTLSNRPVSAFLFVCRMVFYYGRHKKTAVFRLRFFYLSCLK